MVVIGPSRQIKFELNDMPINVNIKEIDEGDGIEAAFVAHSAV